MYGSNIDKHPRRGVVAIPPFEATIKWCDFFLCETIAHPVTDDRDPYHTPSRAPHQLVVHRRGAAASSESFSNEGAPK